MLQRLTDFYLKRLQSYQRLAEEHSNDFYGRFVLMVTAILTVGMAPLVTFDAGGRQSAIDIIRYIAFRGLDRDGWAVVDMVGLMFATTAACVILLGLVLHVVGLAYNDKTMTLIGVGTVAGSIVVLPFATEQVSGIALFGIVSLPSVGWLLIALYCFAAIWLVARWQSERQTHVAVSLIRRERVV